MAKRGAGAEYLVRDLHRATGWLSFRCPASLGIADVVCLKSGERPRLLEVKTGFEDTGPWKHFGPKRRAELLAAGIAAGAEVYLAWCPKGTSWLGLIPSSEWPRG